MPSTPSTPSTTPTSTNTAQPPHAPRRLRVGPEANPVVIGPGLPLAVIAGPCALESFELGLTVAAEIAAACKALGLAYIFKASYDKANRSSITSRRGPGMPEGLRHLDAIRERIGCAVTTDIHDPSQAEPVARVADLLQIPAFLCRQTDLLAAAARAAAEHARGVSVKKGQFLAPAEMKGPVRKLTEAGCDNLLLIERGTFFGYHRLVNDFVGLGDLMELDCSAFSPLGPPPVCFDVTHSTQLPGSGEQTGGRPDRAPLLARAAVAAGVHALFIEAHPDPANAASDAATQLPLRDIPGLLEALARFAALARAGG